MSKRPKRKVTARFVESQADREQRRQADMLRRSVKRQKQLRELSKQIRRVSHAADLELSLLEDVLRRRREVLDHGAGRPVAVGE